jgi:hypothetical protein
MPLQTRPSDSAKRSLPKHAESLAEAPCLKSHPAKKPYPAIPRIETTL